MASQYEIEKQDGQYGYDKPWQLTSEWIAAERTWNQASPPWHPDIPARPDPYEMIPPRFGYRSEELNITDILDGVMSRLQSTFEADASPPTDFSGGNGSIASTMRPTGAGGGGIT